MAWRLGRFSNRCCIISTTVVGDWGIIEDSVGDTGLRDGQWIIIIRGEAHFL